VLPQAYLQKTLDSQKIHQICRKITGFKMFSSKFAVLPKMISLCTLSPKSLYIICKFVKIDHVEAWKISYQQSSGFFQELKTTPLTENFRPISLHQGRPTFTDIGSTFTFFSLWRSTNLAKL